MGSKDKTPKAKKLSPQVVKALCPHCHDNIEVTVAGKFILHEDSLSPWKKRNCRASGDFAIVPIRK